MSPHHPAGGPSVSVLLHFPNMSIIKLKILPSFLILYPTYSITRSSRVTDRHLPQNGLGIDQKFTLCVSANVGDGPRDLFTEQYRAPTFVT